MSPSEKLDKFDMLFVRVLISILLVITGVKLLAAELSHFFR